MYAIYAMPAIYAMQTTYTIYATYVMCAAYAMHTKHLLTVIYAIVRHIRYACCVHIMFVA